tara:strand:- start:140 stop:262 length:123 start_codon:yes stop_codon:yes gene_type:complete
MNKEPKEEEQSMDDWMNNLSEKEQPEVCNLDDEDCEACGS